MADFEMLKPGATWNREPGPAPLRAVYIGRKGNPPLDYLQLEGAGQSPDTITEIRWGFRPPYYVLPTMFGADHSRLVARLNPTGDFAETCIVRLQNGDELRLKVEQPA